MGGMPRSNRLDVRIWTISLVLILLYSCMSTCQSFTTSSLTQDASTRGQSKTLAHPRNSDLSLSKRHSLANADWMRDHSDLLNKVFLRDILLIGTHDAAAYHLSSDIAPEEKRLAGPVYLLFEALNVVLPTGILNSTVTTMRWSHTQVGNLYAQLEHGVRYFDLRVTYHAYSKVWLTKHGLLCPPLKDLLEDVARFLHGHPGEIIILELSHFNNEGAHKLNELNDLIQTHLGEFLAPYDKSKPHAVFDTTYAKLFNSGQRCIIIFGEKNQNHFMNTPWSSDSVYANMPKTADAEKWNLDILRNHGRFDESESERPLLLFWTVTPSDLFVAENFLEDDVSTSPSASLRMMARQMNAAFSRAVNSRASCDLFVRADVRSLVSSEFVKPHIVRSSGSIVVVDFALESDSVEIALSLNRCIHGREESCSCVTDLPKGYPGSQCSQNSDCEHPSGCSNHSHQCLVAHPLPDTEHCGESYQCASGVCDKHERVCVHHEVLRLDKWAVKIIDICLVAVVLLAIWFSWRRKSRSCPKST